MGFLRSICPKLVKTCYFCDVNCVDRSLRNCDQLEDNLSECESVVSCNVNGSKVKVTSVSTCTSSDVCTIDSHWSLLVG